MTTVLIAVDGSDESVAAARAARRLFGADAHYLAVSVVPGPIDPGVDARWGSQWGVIDPIGYGAVWAYPDVVGLAPAGGPPIGGDAGEVRTAEEAGADQAREVVDRAHLEPIEAIGESGDPADAIIAAAREHAADVIVVGSHQRGWLSRLLTPSVAMDVLKHADVPVLVVK